MKNTLLIITTGSVLNLEPVFLLIFLVIWSFLSVMKENSVKIIRIILVCFMLKINSD